MAYSHFTLLIIHFGLSYLACFILQTGEFVCILSKVNILQLFLSCYPKCFRHISPYSLPEGNLLE